MPAPEHKRLFLFLLLWITAFSPALADKPRIGATRGIRFTIGPALSFYSLHTRHAINPFQKFSAIAGFKKEWVLDRANQSFFSTGVDYLYHGLGFKSYYFKPDTFALYDKTFSYDYSVYVHELQLPLQYKLLFKRRANKTFSPFVQAGYHLRYLLTSDVKVTQYGHKVRYDSPPMQFRTPFITGRLNSCVSLGGGFQKNATGADKGNFFVELSFRYGFSDYYFSRSYAPTSLYIQSSHLVLLLGVKL